MKHTMVSLEPKTLQPEGIPFLAMRFCVCPECVAWRENYKRHPEKLDAELAKIRKHFLEWSLDWVSP